MPGLTGRHPSSFMLIGLTNKVTGALGGRVERVPQRRKPEINDNLRGLLRGAWWALYGATVRR